MALCILKKEIFYRLFKMTPNKTHIVLVRLAQRKDPSYSSWYYISDDPKPKHGNCYKCHLCAATIFTSNTLEKHGISHLKRLNLLPFI